MAERNKLFSVAEWAPLGEAYARAQAALGSRQLAEHDVRTHLRGGRLHSARRIIEPDGTEVFEHLKPVFWTKPFPLLPPEVEPWELDEEWKGFFFVSRPELDRLYAAPTKTAGDDAARPKPGPKPKDDWPTWIARWLILKALEYPDELANVDALVGEARLFLQQEEIFAPQDDKRIRKVIADLLLLVKREGSGASSNPP